MITEAKFKVALREMMRTLPLEEINVTALCEKCHCHRQTFYYHYQDIYDLIAAIFLVEDLSALENAPDVKKAVMSVIRYVRDNFSFLRSTYNSAARDLTDDFIFGRLNAKLFNLFANDKNLGLRKESCRNAARRFSHLLSDEFGFCFIDHSLTPEAFSKKMGRFAERAIKQILPSVFKVCKMEERNQSV